MRLSTESILPGVLCPSSRARVPGLALPTKHGPKPRLEPRLAHIPSMLAGSQAQLQSPAEVATQSPETQRSARCLVQARTMQSPMAGTAHLPRQAQCKSSSPGTGKPNGHRRPSPSLYDTGTVHHGRQPAFVSKVQLWYKN